MRGAGFYEGGQDAKASLKLGTGDFDGRQLSDNAPSSKVCRAVSAAWSAAPRPLNQRSPPWPALSWLVDFLACNAAGD